VGYPATEFDSITRLELDVMDDARPVTHVKGDGSDDAVEDLRVRVLVSDVVVVGPVLPRLADESLIAQLLLGLFASEWPSLPA